MARIFLTHDPVTRDEWYGDRALAVLKTLGDVVLRDDLDPLSESRLAQLASGCDIIVSDRLAPAGEKLFSLTPSLKAFVRCAMDIQSIDVEAATRHGVLVTRAGPGYTQAVSEWILAQMINLARDLPGYFMAYQRDEFPNACLGTQLAGKTVGITGYGNIALYLVPILKALGMRVLAHDPWVNISSGQVESVDQATLLKSADFVISLVSHSSKTEKLFGTEAFTSMRRGAYFINAARGGVVDDDALLAALNSNHLGGVALDVGRGVDNTPTSALTHHPRVLATPHIGGMVPEAIEFQAMQTVNQVRDILFGRSPEGSINAELINQFGLSSK